MLDNPKGTRRTREIRSCIARLWLEDARPLLVMPPGNQGNSSTLPDCGECLPGEAGKIDPLVRRHQLLCDIDGESRPIGAAGLAEIGAPVPWGGVSSTREDVQREEVVSGGRNIQRVSLARERPQGAPIAPQVQLRPQGFQIRLGEQQGRVRIRNDARAYLPRGPEESHGDDGDLPRLLALSSSEGESLGCGDPLHLQVVPGKEMALDILQSALPHHRPVARRI